MRRPGAAARGPAVRGPLVARGCASLPGFGWEGVEREREREFGRERDLREGRLGFDLERVLNFFTERKKTSLSDLNVREDQFA